MRYYKSDLIKELNNMEAIHNKKMELLNRLDLKSNNSITWAKICEILKEPSKNPVFKLINYINSNKPYNDDSYYEIFSKVEELGDKIQGFEKSQKNIKPCHDVNNYGAMAEIIYEFFPYSVDEVISIMWEKWNNHKYNIMEDIFIWSIQDAIRRGCCEDSIKYNCAM